MKRSLGLILAIILLILSGCGGSSEKVTKNETVKNGSAKKETAQNLDIGLTVEEYVEEFNNVSASRHSILKLGTVIKETEKDGKGEVYHYLGDSIGLLIEADTATNYISKIIVGCEPKGRNEKRIIERAGVAYIFAIQAASAEITEQKAMTIISRLSTDLKHNKVLEECLEFSSIVYDGVMILRIKAAES